MKIKHLLSAFCVLVSIAVSQSVFAVAVYSENFESITLAGGAGLYSFGYDKNQDTAAGAYKELEYGKWNRQAPAGVSANIDVDGDGDLEIRPNDNGKNNAKMWGTLIDPSTFASTGSGTYTFNVDIIGADEGVSRFYLYSARGYDGSGSNDLIFDAAEAGLSTYVPFLGSGATIVNEIVTHDIDDETASSSFSYDFTYTEGDAIGISFGSYNTAVAFDNITISAVPEPSTYALFIGFASFLFLAIKRRK
jgi:hypothetical protein